MSYADIQFPRKAQILFRPARYKVLYSGRGAAKSWSIARALILKAHTTPKDIDGLPFKILCAREIQTSIKDSVHALLKNQIIKLGLGNHFKITDISIVSRVTGAEFIFKGLRSNINEVKSMEDVDICWVEEAQSVSKKSWDVLGPTIRKPGSEIWISFNPDDERDDTYQRFVVNPSSDVVSVKMYWWENPWFTDELEKERISLKKKADANPEVYAEDYAHIWDGDCKKFPDAVIFKGRYDILNFDWKEVLAKHGTEPGQVRWFHGNDFGFANDPNYMGRSFITGSGNEEELWVQDECFGYGIEIDNLSDLFDGKVPNKRGIETARTWPIKADCARPEIISYLSRQGYNIEAAEKWPGSLEDGIAHLKMFKKIHIHAENCPLAQTQARLYSFKVDKNKVDKDGKPEILPIIVDKHNDFWDQCIAKGEMVTTEIGNKPIEEVSTVDKVLTRDGFKRVLQARKTSDSKFIWEVRAGGRILLATPDHKVFTVSRGFVRVDELRYTDEVLTEWQNALFSTVKNSINTKGINTFQEGTSCYIEKYGSSTTGKSPKDFTSTIKTIPQKALQIFAILNANRGLGICRSTSKKDYSNQNLGLEIPNISKLYPLLQSLGIQLLKVKDFIAEYLQWLESNLFPSINLAYNAPSCSPPKNLGVLINSAQTNVSQHGAEIRELITRIEYASSAARSLGVTSIPKRKLVPARVQCVRDTGLRSAVYDLSVEDSPEFVVSGILVHNCRYALDGFIQRRGVDAIWAKLGQ